MNQANLLSQIILNPGCMDDYDPDSMSVVKARKFIRDFLTPISETEPLCLQDALGRIISKDILSPSNVPNYNNSAMDGYAFNADDIKANSETYLKVIGTVFAGKSFNDSLNQGECVRIMTGGMIPSGADTVIMQERVSLKDGFITFTDAPKRTMNVRYAGEDVKINEIILTKGHKLRPADLGLIASLGIDQVTVYRRLKVAFFSTGDELQSVGKPLQAGQVYDSNRYTIFGMLSRMKVEMYDMGAIPDDPELLEMNLLKASNQADIIITSGGVSVGEADYMKLLLAKHGQVVFWKLAMKPGRPMAYGKVNQSHYFGLPGNPVAVMVTFYQFVREAILVLMGQPHPEPLPRFNVVCTEKIKKIPGRTEYQRGIMYADIDGIWKVKPTGEQGSAILRSMSLANCFIVLDETVGNLEAGSIVQVEVLEGIV